MRRVYKNSQRTEEHRKEPEKKKRRISKPKNKALDSIPRQNEVERSKTNERQSSGTLDNVLDSVKGQEEPSRKQLENDISGNESQRNADAFQASAKPIDNIHDMDLGNDTIKKEPIGNVQLFNSLHYSFFALDGVLLFYTFQLRILAVCLHSNVNFSTLFTYLL